jgi:hypothetical protein
MNNNEIDREIGWEDSIEREGGDFILLPAGDYNFTVISFERARHAGSDKLPPCNKAIIHCEIDAPEGKVEIKNNLFLHTKTEGLLSAFFSSIGQKKKGEKLQMNWAAVVGSTGRCKVGTYNWTSDKGDTMQSNDIKKFYPKEDTAVPAFQPGSF